MQGFNRITFDPHIMGGQACVRGMRISVSLILSLVANGLTYHQIIEEYPDLQDDDIKECLQYAAYLAKEETHSLVEA